MITRYLSGDKKALSLLVGKWHKVFCEKAYWVLKDKNLAKDVAQDSWIIIIKNLANLKNKERFKSWALKIVYTKAIDVQKKKYKTVLESLSDNYISINNEEENGYEIRVRKKLYRAIQHLPKDKQDIIRLFYVEEYNVKEISKFLNIPEGTVKSRLFKAREKLKNEIK